MSNQAKASKQDMLREASNLLDRIEANLGFIFETIKEKRASNKAA